MESEAGPGSQSFTAEERRITLIALLIVFLLAALDQSIVSTAMPRIAAELSGLNLYTWVTTAYMLAQTVTVPIYGKLNDIYGRKPVLLAGIGIFTLGSVLCGLAGEFGRLPLLGGGMTQLIVFRGLQGLGGGALFTSAFAIVADLFPPRERGKFSGLFGAMFGVAGVLGPVIGGFLTDLGTLHIGAVSIQGWRWVFYINLPLCLLAIFMVAVKMPKLIHRNPGPIDFVGAALIVATFVPMLLALSWGGRDYAWNSPTIIHLSAISAAALVAFLVVEARVKNPILHLGMFRNRVFATCNLAAFITSMAFLGTLLFLPLYMQLGQGVSATRSGLSLLPLTLGLVISAGGCGRLVSRTGRYKPFMLGGALLMMLGLYLISRIDAETGSLDLGWRALIFGIGLGPAQSLFSLAVQNAAPPSQLGVATSASQFFRQIGSTVGVAVFGAVMTWSLAVGAPAAKPGEPVGHVLTIAELESMAAAGQAGGKGLAQLDPQGRALVAHAITNVMLVGVGVAGAGVLAILMIPELPLRHRGEAPAPAAAAAEPKARGRKAKRGGSSS
jgi:EmrB/QacA subfamily drug resistance transporter